MTKKIDSMVGNIWGVTCNHCGVKMTRNTDSIEIRDDNDE